MRVFLMVLACVVLLAIPTMAQISISTNTYQPAVGTVIRMFTDTAVTAAFYDSLAAGTGGPTVWDFTGKPFVREDSFMIVSPSAAPLADSFPTANLVLLAISGDTSEPDSSWSFVSSLPASYSSLGSVDRGPLGTTVTVFQGTTPEVAFPVNNGNQWTSQRSWSISQLVTRTDFFDTTTYNVDGWGTVKYGSNVINVLRVSSTKRLTTRTFVGGSALDSSLIVSNVVSFIAPGSPWLVSVAKTTLGGLSSYSATATAEFLGTPTGVTEDDIESLPHQFTIAQNYPNPFNPNTTISFTVPVRSEVRLAVYNLAGQEVRVLVSGTLNAGSHTATWDGTNRAGLPVASGVYFYRIDANQFTGVRKMLLLK